MTKNVLLLDGGVWERKFSSLAEFLCSSILFCNLRTMISELVKEKASCCQEKQAVVVAAVVTTMLTNYSGSNDPLSSPSTDANAFNSVCSACHLLILFLNRKPGKNMLLFQT